MEGTPRLYDTLVQVLSQHQNWLDFAISRPWPGCWWASCSLETSVSRPGYPMCTAAPCMHRVAFAVLRVGSRMTG